MMRIGFLPSDFNPMILMLAEADHCRALGGVLRRFARDGQDVVFARLTFCQLTGINLLLTADPGPPGVQCCDGQAFSWRVVPDTAIGLADRLDDLARPERIAGSEDLDQGIQDGIAVRVSRGEFADDFLRPLQPCHRQSCYHPA